MFYPPLPCTEYPTYMWLPIRCPQFITHRTYESSIFTEPHLKKDGSVIQSYLMLCEVNYDLHFHRKGHRKLEGLSNLHKTKHLLCSITEIQTRTFFYSIFSVPSSSSLVIKVWFPRAAVSSPLTQTNWTRNSGSQGSAIWVLVSPSGDPDALKLENCCSTPQGLKSKLYV